MDSTINNSNISGNSLIDDEKKNNNKLEQMKLMRNLKTGAQEKENYDDISTPKTMSENSSIINKVEEPPTIPLINYQESYNYFQSLIITNQNNIIEEKSSNCCSCSSEKIKKQKIFILNLSRIKYDENNNIHFRILFSIYYFFTKKNCKKEGEHWQDIGFQSDTPSTDLISVGMFGPLQILYGINVYPDLYRNLFQYLLIRKCELFFIGNLISFSKFCLNILERGLLDENVNENDNLLRILNEIYVGMSVDFFNDIQRYGNGNTLTIEFIVKTIQKISEKRTIISYFLSNHQSH